MRDGRGNTVRRHEKLPFDPANVTLACDYATGDGDRDHERLHRFLAGELAQRIAKAIDDWRVENPEATDEDVCHAIERVLAAMRSG